jgi:N-acetylglutamate synthase-like GNAT family acetyltransferase
MLTIWDDDVLAGVGALKRLSADHGEVKSMYTAQPARRRGAGSAMLGHIIATARAGGMSRLSLETGAWDYFVPAICRLFARQEQRLHVARLIIHFSFSLEQSA